MFTQLGTLVFLICQWFHYVKEMLLLTTLSFPSIWHHYTKGHGTTPPEPNGHRFINVPLCELKPGSDDFGTDGASTSQGSACPPGSN